MNKINIDYIRYNLQRIEFAGLVNVMDNDSTVEVMNIIHDDSINTLTDLSDELLFELNYE